jgi:hypothetical protein
LVAGEGAPETTLLSRTVWDRPRYALRDEKYKFFYDTRTGESALYDLEKDPGEKHDLKGSEPLRTAYEEQTLHSWIRALSAREHEEGGSVPDSLTRQQCENLKSMGYLPTDFPCPKS